MNLCDDRNDIHMCGEIEGHQSNHRCVLCIEVWPNSDMGRMSFNQWLLTKLAEEGVEVAQRALKTQQFGFDEVQKEQVLTNSERLGAELVDLYATAMILLELGLIPDFRSTDLQDAKRNKLNKYLQYSRELGTVAPGPLVPGRKDESI